MRLQKLVVLMPSLILLSVATVIEAAQSRLFVANNLTPVGNVGGRLLEYNGTSGEFLNETAKIETPFGICVGPDGSLYVASANQASILRFGLNSGVSQSTFVPSGSGGLVSPWGITFGPDGNLYNCPGFTGDASQSTGHIDGREESWRAATAERFARLTAHKEECGDCSFVPVCGGGCSVAAHTELGDMHQASCHKGAFESALVSLAERTAAASL